MPRSLLRAHAAHWWAQGREVYADQANSLCGAYVKSRVLPAISEWREAPGLPLAGGVEVHLLTCAGDWLCAAWTLASFVHFTQHRWHLVVHDDGTLPAQARSTLRQLFPALEIIARAEANAAMSLQLAQFPRCAAYRAAHPLALKLLDCALLSQTDRLILLDSDILFFQRPTEVMQWVREEREGCFFNPDFQNAYCLSPEEAQSRLGTPLWPRVNTGLSLFVREAVDLAFCERCLGDEALLDPESIAWREQTLLALCASRWGQGGLLSERYEVTFNPRMAEDAVTRHYVGAMRRWFLSEGVRRLRPILLP